MYTHPALSYALRVLYETLRRLVFQFAIKDDVKRPPWQKYNRISIVSHSELGRTLVSDLSELCTFTRGCNNAHPSAL